MSKSTKFLSQFNESDFESEHPGITGQNMSSDDMEAMLLNARINKQKSKAARALIERSVVFEVAGYERSAHSPMLREVVGTLKEAKQLARTWIKSQQYLEEVEVTKHSRPQSWPSSYGFRNSKLIGSFKKQITHNQELDNGPITTDIKWVWE